MTSQWSRFESSAGRTNRALGAEPIDVYEPSESYTAGDGWSVSYPSSPTTSTSGEVVPPESDPNIDTGGTSQTADLNIYVPWFAGYGVDGYDEVDYGSGIQWTDYGESGEAATRVEIDGAMYEVEAVDEQFDGRNRLACTEVDA